MIPLILSVLASSLIFVLFKLFDRFRINTFQAIVVNYFTAFTIGIALYSNEWQPTVLNDLTWMFYSAGTAVLFIGLFLLMGISSQRNGVASTSIAVKMSMAVSLVIMILAYNESTSALKISGIILAILGVFLVSFSKNSKKADNAIWMLGVLFIGSGALDFILNYVQRAILSNLTTSLYSAISLGMAGIIGSIILVYQLITKKTTLEFRNIVAGLVLGIPNYFSIYLLLLSYKTTGWKDSTVLAITNVSVVLLSAVMGFLAFKENAGLRKIIGLIAAISAIVSLYFAN